jgi:hypothetical protein
MLILLVSKYTPESSRAVIKKAAFCTTALPVGLSQWWQLVSISISARLIVSCPIPRIGLAMPGLHREVPLLGKPLSRQVDSERLTTKAALRQSVEELTRLITNQLHLIPQLLLKMRLFLRRSQNSIVDITTRCGIARTVAGSQLIS